MLKLYVLAPEVNCEPNSEFFCKPNLWTCQERKNKSFKKLVKSPMRKHVVKDSRIGQTS